MMIWGHRGHRRHRFADKYTRPQPYENSLQAYEQTLKYCMGLECDIIQSREATVYLAHDTLFDGIVHYELKTHLLEESKQALGNGFIYQTSDDVIRALKLRDDQSIPRLRDLLKIMPNYPGRVLNLELKGPNTADIALRTVERAIQDGLITPQQIVFSSFNLPALRDLRHKTGHRFKIGALFVLKNHTMSPMFPSWPNAPQDASYVPFKLEDNILERDDIRDIAPDFFNLERGSVDRAAIDAIHEKFPQAKIILWTAGEPYPTDDASLIDLIEKLAGTNKIHAVITDFPNEVQEILEKRKISIYKP